jgi:uncharacterized protein (DUF952 family)
MSSPGHPDIAYKICTRAEWSQALARGVFEGSPVDRTDGFIHLSAPDQVRATADKWFAGQADLVLVAIDLTALGETVVWEASRGGALFPHIYGPLPTSAARDVQGLAWSPDAGFAFPEGIP